MVVAGYVTVERPPPPTAASGGGGGGGSGGGNSRGKRAAEQADKKFAAFRKLWELSVAAVSEVDPAYGVRKTPFFLNTPCLSTFPMFVPSLSWQNDRFYMQMAQKGRFFPQEAFSTIAVTKNFVGSPHIDVRKKRSFIDLNIKAIYISKRSFYQDRLGTNIGKPQKADRIRSQVCDIDAQYGTVCTAEKNLLCPTF